MNSRAKGKAGELEAAIFLREHGFDEVRRGVQYRGGGDSPDLVGLPGCHVEVKRVERGSLYDWLDQAQRDSAGTGRIPVVAHRRNRKEWVAILPLADFLKLIIGEGDHADRGKP